MRSPCRPHTLLGRGKILAVACRRSDIKYGYEATHCCCTCLAEPLHIQLTGGRSNRPGHAATSSSTSRLHFPDPAIVCADERATGECFDPLHHLSTGTESRHTGGSGPLHQCRPWSARDARRPPGERSGGCTGSQRRLHATTDRRAVILRSCLEYSMLNYSCQTHRVHALDLGHATAKSSGYIEYFGVKPSEKVSCGKKTRTAGFPGM